MPLVPKETIEKAREMDLLTYLRSYEPNNLKHVRGEVYCTAAHDSLKISNGKWMWWSRGIGGHNALDYLIKVEGLSLPAAAERILGQAAFTPSETPKSQQPKDKTLLLPPKNFSAEKVKDYLLGRKIAPEIIQYCLDAGILYESSPHHNAVFIGRDAGKKPRYANLRGTHGDFKGEAAGSDKRYSFSLPADGNGNTVHLFESAIDALSYATLVQAYRRKWDKEHLLSLAGIYLPNNKKEQRLPLALEQYLKDHPQIERVVLRLDNDKAGRAATVTLTGLLSEQYTVFDKAPPKGKDFNEYLQILVTANQPEKSNQPLKSPSKDTRTR